MEAWNLALDELERALIPGTESVAGWTPPQHLGPMPEELASRARRLLSLQRQAIEGLHESRREVGRHLAALGSIPEANEHRPSAYLDVSG